MNRKNKIIISSLGLSLMLGGCFDMNNEGTKKTTEKQTAAQEEEQTEDVFVSVQDYKGEGYELDNGEKTDKIAEANREKIDEAVKAFFQDTYKTEVVVHNVVGAVDGATVFVESVGEPHFYTYAIVPIKGDKVLTDKVWSQEGQVESAIRGGLYGILYDKELQTLNEYLEKVTIENPVVGTRIEAIENVGATGYSTPFYYITVLDESFDILYDKYIENPDTTKKTINQLINKEAVDPNMLRVTIHLYMKEKNTEPEKRMFDQIIKDIEEMEGLPPASYSIFLNDNTIDRKSADGTKENTLEKTDPDYIVKP